MKTKSKRFLSALLTLMLALSLFAAYPMTASALTPAEVLRDTINFFNHGGTGTLSAVYSGEIVTVTGTGAVTGVTNTLELDIVSGVTVVWKADYSGSLGGALIELTGSGTFEAAAGSSLKNGGGDAIFSSGANAKIVVSGGTVSSAAKERSAIFTGGANSEITVSSGALSASAEKGYAIYNGGTGAKITVTGGTLSTTGLNGHAIWNVGSTTTVTVSGGTVKSAYNAIKTEGANSNITVSGSGTVSSTGSSAIYAYSGNSTVNVIGGNVSAALSYAIYNSGGGNFIVNIIGGTVSSAYNTTIRDGGTGVGSSTTVNGGFVFGFNTTITEGEDCLIYVRPAATRTIGGTAVVCAWDKTSGTLTYEAGSQANLTVSPTAAKATWDKEGSQNGIRYENGTNKGFFPVSGVTVNAAEAVEPAAPTNLTATVGATGITLKWTDNSDNETGFVIERKDGSGSWGQMDSVGANITTYKDTNVQAGKTYSYKVAVTTSEGSFGYSNEVTATMGAPTGSTTGDWVNPFTDVKSSDWFYNDVKTACILGLINGKTPTTFAPKDDLTYAEAVKLASCMHQKHTTGSVTLVNSTGSDPWYKSYADYAKTYSIISKDYNWNVPATRSGYMEIFANAIPLDSINTIADGSIPDVPTSHPQAAAIYKLYRAGILQGVNAAHNCSPGSNIQRSEVATILTRMMDEDERVSFSM